MAHPDTADMMQPVAPVHDGGDLVGAQVEATQPDLDPIPLGATQE